DCRASGKDREVRGGDRVAVVGETNAALTAQANVIERDAVFGIGDSDPDFEPIDTDTLQQRRPRPFALQRDADRSAVGRRGNVHVPNRTDIVSQVVDTDRAGISMANVYREIFDEILVGIVAFALVGVILPAAGGIAV